MTIPEALFDSPAMLVVGRLLVVAAACVLLVGAVFVLGSMAARMRRGHWLKRAGPFEVSESTIGEVDVQTQALVEALATRTRQLVEVEFLLARAGRALGKREDGDS